MTQEDLDPQDSRSFLDSTACLTLRLYALSKPATPRCLLGTPSMFPFFVVWLVQVHLRGAHIWIVHLEVGCNELLVTPSPMVPYPKPSSTSPSTGQTGHLFLGVLLVKVATLAATTSTRLPPCLLVKHPKEAMKWEAAESVGE